MKTFLIATSSLCLVSACTLTLPTEQAMMQSEKPLQILPASYQQGQKSIGNKRYVMPYNTDNDESFYPMYYYGI